MYHNARLHERSIVDTFGDGSLLPPSPEEMADDDLEVEELLHPLSGMPRVPLTERQYEDYLVLTAEAAAHFAEGRYEDADRVSRLAANILRTSAPALE